MNYRLLKWVLIIASVLAVSWYYNYQSLLGERPQSYHHWRQSDCASLADNFYKQDLPFWEPQINGLVSDNGITGKNAPSEVAVYYWVAGQLNHILGSGEMILRTLNTALFLVGIVALIHGLWVISQGLLWSIALGLLLFSSPILVYYGNSYLTNAPALGMALCGLSAMISFQKNRKRKYWWIATLFFFLAGSLKLPGLFLFFAIGGSVLFFPRRNNVLHLLDYLISALIILAPLLAWVYYANHYNHIHHTTYFSTTIYPIWEFSTSELSFFIIEMQRLWWGEHFHPMTLLLFFLILVFLLFQRKRLPGFWLRTLLFLFVGLGLYSLLQFYTFMSHDYYTINMFMLFALILVLLTYYIRETMPKLFNSKILLPVLFVILFANVYYARHQLDFRYQEFPNEFAKNYPLLYESNDEWLTEIGVHKSDTIIFIPDYGHTSLYLLNRYGWTSHTMANKDTSKTIRFNQDEEGVQHSIDHGASYLFVYGVIPLMERTYLHPFTKHLVGRKEDLFVFDLRDTSRNFTLPERELLQRIKFNFNNRDTVEAISSRLVADSEFENDLVLAAAKDDEFLAGYDLQDLEPGMLVEVEIRVKTHPDAKVVPVISSIEHGLAFEQRMEILKVEEGWRLLRQQLIITEAISRQGVKIFIWNPEHYEACYDDLEIRIYKKNPLEIIR